MKSQTSSFTGHGIAWAFCLFIATAYAAAQQNMPAEPTTGLPAPANVQAKNGSTPTEVLVTWNAVPGATSYKIMRGDTDASAAASAIQDVTGTSYDDKSLAAGGNYYYWVVAYNGSGPSPLSTIASAAAGELVWEDTFGVDGIKPAWGRENAMDPNNRNVVYTNTPPEQSSTTRPTTLEIVADPQATNGRALAMSMIPLNGKYNSAEISTKRDPAGAANKLMYGTIQARIKIPGGDNSNAIWPAFWMLGTSISTTGWPSCGEIDIMENRGSKPSTILATLHGPMANRRDYNNGSGLSASYSLPQGENFYSKYHVFTVNWQPDLFTFAVDGKVYETQTPKNLPAGATWVFNGQPFYLIFDVCEGGGFAPGTITSKQTMYVDYVRAYRH